MFDNTQTSVSERVKARISARLTEQKGYLTGRDQMTLEVITDSFVEELVGLGLVQPDPIVLEEEVDTSDFDRQEG